MAYEYTKTKNDPDFWNDFDIRVKPIHDMRHNGGFSLDYALEIGLVWENE